MTKRETQTDRAEFMGRILAGIFRSGHRLSMKPGEFREIIETMDIDKLEYIAYYANGHDDNPRFLELLEVNGLKVVEAPKLHD